MYDFMRKWKQTVDPGLQVIIFPHDTNKKKKIYKREPELRKLLPCPRKSKYRCCLMKTREARSDTKYEKKNVKDEWHKISRQMQNEVKRVQS